MKEHLQTLQEKITSTWALLDIDGQKEELKKIEQAMQAEGFWNDTEQATKISKRHEELKSEIDTWQSLKDEVDGLLSLSQELEDSPDADMESEIDKKITSLEVQFETLEFILLFDGRHDRDNALVTIQAGSGGTEAQDWAEMLERMILRFVEKKGWKATLLDESKGAEAGIKSATIEVEGRYAFGHLKSEHGTHRLVRLSPFDAEGMRHTSFASIEVIPEMEIGDAVVIDPKELRVDTFMSGGKGGQSVNTTYSAVRIVHLPTGITVQCQNERSQVQNKESAMRVLQAKLQKLQEEQEEEERLKLRGEHKSPEWGNQIRNYVLHPYHLVKDVRTKHETADDVRVLNGEIDDFIEAYLRWIKSQNM
ncbi:MAG: peptide chain release factor 2 [Candidatus Magasanikbacteria bacterium CG_4_9_14_0_2_um_filter_42_11]|uniref:Peptide chain release factor 2 n=1 Tax=Candidatus Magasanikbacteria bacterium CG_4_9_14_0_2_um_filter_42_11 TaxID=1974643 RepID=A0A2M8FB38_9BACT|nr:MAG: peptide chain release factor 2 [Candidatus Magasanikbacteria bacterium CG10_big_fil_rev_8_21_14_0_10_43_9]PIY92176.1 MAG: peptide chain release factor 2 [Candidatus Magasanikbacteria bacterium CG_4_10_14_0_8_um_filter_42_12]PJC52936.1 MAG: peptide chain release factor 2 [Candidatus Magasanikbacteria bacterium CG_4_9_14_0_2_um_filter_42_11]